MPTSSISRPLGSVLLLAALTPTLSLAAGPIPIDATPTVLVDTSKEPVAEGKFQPTWKSLEQYEVPEWFRDAKFGIWAHWGPQCEPESGDWYARNMYLPGEWQHQAHLDRYGDPAQFGFKDVIHQWKANHWDPERLVKLYKDCGAQYFFAMANHHDNLDLWNSRYQPWNSTTVGPKKDIIGGWAKAAKAQGLPFGVSVHAAHAWSWYEPAQSADAKLTLADGKGQWWEGLDPQDLYAQNHTPSPDYMNSGGIHARWNWGGGVSQPDQDYCDKFYNRTADLIHRYQPDLLYFDDTALPLWPVSDAGLQIAADFYNSNLKNSSGKRNGVLFGKILNDDQLKCLTWDIERGVPNRIFPYPWQTDTCIGAWHYDRGIYDRGHYKSPQTVIQMLADIVSKNGNLLLNIPVRGDGSIDDKEEQVLKGIAAWMKVNSEAIHSTRPWRSFGEGPASEGAELSAQGFNEGRGKPFTAEDVRYTQSKDSKTLYVIVMGVPQQALRLTHLGKDAGPETVRSITLLGAKGSVKYQQDSDALVIEPPRKAPAHAEAIVYKISL
ncbi:alpha-L-fucosidase [Haloferula luteola]|uniref:alpha-L-fucosidase n=1 Tax=Haloferula luteola TaxID=595692 RepID=A0A840UYP0_9BACT|nr:alpha-L-fucosidase [Haloferula luteola]MBB5349946.1 alpha-L-fucosidase [Haloferula luteola]